MSLALLSSALEARSVSRVNLVRIVLGWRCLKAANGQKTTNGIPGTTRQKDGGPDHRVTLPGSIFMVCPG
jgi:hypothetical protein